MTDNSRSRRSPFQELAADFWMAEQLATIRQDHEIEMQKALSALIRCADEMERLCDDPSFEHLPEAWQTGLRVLKSSHQKSLADLGLQRISAIGEVVDPEFHHIVETIDNGGTPEMIVREEVAGYMWKERLFRPASVVSTRSPSASLPNPDSSENAFSDEEPCR